MCSARLKYSGIAEVMVKPKFAKKKNVKTRLGTHHDEVENLRLPVEQLAVGAKKICNI